MPVYLLKAKTGVGYDAYDGFVISAKTEQDARQVAQMNGGDEVGWYEDNKKDFWTDFQLTTCEELHSNWMPGMVLSSFNAG